MLQRKQSYYNLFLLLFIIVVNFKVCENVDNVLWRWLINRFPSFDDSNDCCINIRSIKCAFDNSKDVKLNSIIDSLAFNQLFLFCVR